MKDIATLRKENPDFLELCLAREENIKETNVQLAKLYTLEEELERVKTEIETKRRESSHK